MQGTTASDYAPYPLSDDPVALGLAESTVTSALGTVVARSRVTSRSRRATIFLHGGAGSWTTWTPLLRAAERQKIPITNPLLLDLPGWGDATLTSAGAAAMLEALTSLVRASAEALGYTEWDLVGHSMGGFVAMHMAAIWPESVLSVATVSATSWTMIDAARHPVRRFVRMPRFVLLWRAMQAMAHLGGTGARLALGLNRLHLLRAAVAPLFRYSKRVPANVIAAFGRELRPSSFAAAVTMGNDYDPSRRWAEIECPVRALRGDRDVFAPADDIDRLGETLPSAHRQTLARCGHFAHIERPDEVLAALGYKRTTP
jgi:pimeloyl-ACP methyl ester carboxylesterase